MVSVVTISEAAFVGIPQSYELKPKPHSKIKLTANS